MRLSYPRVFRVSCLKCPCVLGVPSLTCPRILRFTYPKVLVSYLFLWFTCSCVLRVPCLVSKYLMCPMSHVSHVSICITYPAYYVSCVHKSSCLWVLYVLPPLVLRAHYMAKTKRMYILRKEYASSGFFSSKNFNFYFCCVSVFWLILIF